MKKWNIMALCVGTLDLFKAIVTLPLDFDKYIREPMFAFAVWDDIVSSCAISLLDLPSTISFKTSYSLAVKFACVCLKFALDICA